MRIYTFTLPKFVSGIVRKCMVVFSKEDTAKAKSSTAAASKKRKKRQEKTSG
ncbi:stage V sporulation protein SpoVM [Sporosarcina gallistercoris]|uniref:Stage V sporulation protein SpoVM n=1 Tax=Sporosarcina gallistercoris TaxID=2762245 RepID=A0ABR8PGA7_9BACL|nr:stage V sporulation protein SpoVM [Sporosarcina gallistercoris]MBD7907173.1 stage V sporulation protein SpoVM [Sporosarcina gallistercoris]